MMKYDLPLFRPPSEARSLLLQVTIGCSHNKCTFCSMYTTKKYRERSYEDIAKDIETLKRDYQNSYEQVNKAFLCDGDALSANTELLVEVMNKIKIEFPEIRRIGVYATFKNIIDKSDEELKRLKNAGLDICYIGLESGSEDVLKLIKKENIKDEMILCGERLKKNRIKVSMIALLGVGGRELSKSHTRDTGKIVNIVAPEYFSFLTLVIVPGTPHERLIEKKIITPLTHKELLIEMKEIIERINSPTSKIIFRANHVSNNFPLAGVMPKDNQKMLHKVEEWITDCPENTYPNIDYRYL